MSIPVTPLTAVQIKNAKPKEKQYKLYDGGGLYLLVSPAGGKHWKLKYTQANGKEGTLSFGAFPLISLEQARRKRDEARTQIAEGLDPAETKKQQKLAKEAASKYTFQAMAETWKAIHSTKVTASTMRVYLCVLDKYLLPYLAPLQIDKITPQEYLAVFRQIEDKDHIAMARKALNICNSIANYAIGSGLIFANPLPSLRLLLKSKKIQHRAATIEPDFIGNYLKKLATMPPDRMHPVFRYALQIMPYVFVRSSELAKALWADIDFAACQWRYVVSKTNTPDPATVLWTRS